MESLLACSSQSQCLLWTCNIILYMIHIYIHICTINVWKHSRNAWNKVISPWFPENFYRVQSLGVFCPSDSCAHCAMWATSVTWWMLHHGEVHLLLFFCPWKIPNCQHQHLLKCRILPQQNTLKGQQQIQNCWKEWTQWIQTEDSPLRIQVLRFVINMKLLKYFFCCKNNYNVELLKLKSFFSLNFYLDTFNTR